MGDRKILVNTSVGPTFEVDALKKWLGTCKPAITCVMRPEWAWLVML